MLASASKRCLPNYLKGSASCLRGRASHVTQRRFSSEPESSPTNTEPLVYPKAPNAKHSDLSTFMSYAERTGLDTKSTTYVGTHYEYTASRTLARFGMSLERVGGAGDYGIDLLGTWSLPSAASGSRSAFLLKVLIQCKAGPRTGPHFIRELEGAFVGAPPGWRGGGVVGFLVGEKEATKGVREALGRSRWPMGYIYCTREGLIKQMLWNQRMDEEGLEGIDVGKRFSDSVEELVLMRDGRPLPSIVS